jgi:hypothetical protein
MDVAWTGQDVKTSCAMSIKQATRWNAVRVGFVCIASFSFFEIDSVICLKKASRP